MNIEEFREYCLSFKGVHEKMPFPNVPDQYSRDVLCFYVADKWFCFVNIEIFDFCCIKCNPDESGELQTEYAGIKPVLSGLLFQIFFPSFSFSAPMSCVGECFTFFTACTIQLRSQTRIFLPCIGRTPTTKHATCRDTTIINFHHTRLLAIQ
jgi:hypothetical protein